MTTTFSVTTISPIEGQIVVGELTGNEQYDPATGAPLNIERAAWQGVGVAVRVVERRGKGRLWLSQVDEHGTMHTQEFDLVAGEHVYGQLAVVVELD